MRERERERGGYSRDSLGGGRLAWLAFPSSSPSPFLRRRGKIALNRWRRREARGGEGGGDRVEGSREKT